MERQAQIACESLREFGGSMSSSAMTVVSPRPERRPSHAFVQCLAKLDVEYLALDIVSPCPQSGPSYKTLSLAAVEARSGPPVLVQLDSDTLFLDEPSRLYVDEGVAARPVDDRGFATTGPEHPVDGFWRAACLCLDLSYDELPSVRTTVTDVDVKVNYNGGLISARRDLGLYRHAMEFLRRLLAAGVLPPVRRSAIRTGAEIVDGPGARFFGMDQAALALACVALKADVRSLPSGYNFPVHMLDQIKVKIPYPLVHIHYHWLGEMEAGSNPLLSPRLGLSDEQLDWIRSRLPIPT